MASRAGHEIALAYVQRIESFCQKLALASERGRSRNDLLVGLRIIGFERRVTIAFSVDTENVYVLRVLYGGVNIDDIL